MAVLIFIVILGVLIFVHEMGHFVTARRNGIRADEFGFGFPPRIFGVQRMEGKKREKFSEIESLEVEKIDLKKGKEEIIQETITEKIHTGSRKVPVKKWRIIWGGRDGDDEGEKESLEETGKNKYTRGTIYSLNWIPLGGFVKIKGEDGGSQDPDSFASKSAWIRTKVLAGGVAMNFVLAWFLITMALVIGAPEPVDSEKNYFPNSKIQISSLVSESPAEKSGLKIGDEVLKIQKNASGERVEIKNIKDVQEFIGSQKGLEMKLGVKRGRENMEIKVVPRADFPQGEGPLGISLAETEIVKYPFYEAVWKGFLETASLIAAIAAAFFEMLKGIFLGRGIGADVAGPVGIAYLTKDVAQMGFVYIIQFAALLSINLGIINALPIPALDGGRIMFIIIEKLRGYPISQKTESFFHTTFFIFLIVLMILVTFKDVVRIFR